MWQRIRDTVAYIVRSMSRAFKKNYKVVFNVYLDLHKAYSNSYIHNRKEKRSLFEKTIILNISF